MTEHSKEYEENNCEEAEAPPVKVEPTKEQNNAENNESNGPFLYHEEGITLFVDNMAQTFMALHKLNCNRAFNFKFNKKAVAEKKLEQQAAADTIKQSEKLLKEEIEKMTELSEQEKEDLINETKQSIKHFTLSLEIRSLLEDYRDIEFHYHLFPGDNDLEQTKMDTIFNCIIYDGEYLGIDLISTYELYSLGGAVATCIASYIMGLAFSELPFAYSAMIFDRKNGPMGNGWTALIVAFVFSLVFAIKPLIAYKMAFGLSTGTYFGINMFTQFATLMFLFIIVDINKNVLINQCIALLLLAGAEFFFYSGNISISKNHEVTNSIELMKSVLSPELPEDQIEQVEIQLLNIKEKLGDDAFNRVLLDFALTGNALSLIYVSHPIIPIRALYDKEYQSRIFSWGGGYPRPICEIIEKLYAVEDQQMVSSHFTLDESTSVSDFTNQQIQQIKDKLKKKYENANTHFRIGADEVAKEDHRALNTIIEESVEIKKSSKIDTLYQRISIM